MGVWGGEARKNREIVKPLTLKVVQLERPESPKQIVDVQQTKTQPPEKASMLAAQDHRAIREQRVKSRPSPTLDTQGNASATGRPAAPEGPRLLFDPKGQVRALGKVRNQYEALLRDQVAAAERGGKRGGAEFLDERLPEGDRVDLNTTNYKYISYFLGIRKAIELTWVYPSAAVRNGLQGEVQLEFKIEKDGRMSKIRVLNSSGYELLDKAIVDAIRLAAPFAPLPKSMAKDTLVVTATFRYVLYAAKSLTRQSYSFV